MDEDIDIGTLELGEAVALLDQVVEFENDQLYKLVLGNKPGRSTWSYLFY